LAGGVSDKLSAFAFLSFGIFFSRSSGGGEVHQSVSVEAQSELDQISKVSIDAAADKTQILSIKQLLDKGRQEVGFTGGLESSYVKNYCSTVSAN
jgi:hypothetical protein